MALEFFDILLLVSALIPSSIIMGYMTLRVITVHDQRKTKSESIRNVLKELGIKNFDVKDLDVLSKEGFSRLVWVIRETRGQSGQQGGPMGQLTALMEGINAMKGIGSPQTQQAVKVDQ